MKYFFQSGKKKRFSTESMRFRIFRSFVQLCEKNKVHLYTLSSEKKNKSCCSNFIFETGKRREMMIACFKILYISLSFNI